MKMLRPLVFCVALIVISTAHACSCIWERDTTVTDEMLADTSLYIFSGEVLSSRKVTKTDDLGRTTPFMEVTVILKERFRSPGVLESDTVLLHTGINMNLDCGVSFRNGETYLLVGRQSSKAQGIYTNYCYPNKPLREAAFELARLKN